MQPFKYLVPIQIGIAFRLKKYPWIPVSLMVTILDRLEKPVLLVAIIHFAAWAKSRELLKA